MDWLFCVCRLSDISSMRFALRHLFNSYKQCYDEFRTQLSLDKDAPIRRDPQRGGRLLPLPILGGLHHQYVRI